MNESTESPEPAVVDGLLLVLSSITPALAGPGSEAGGMSLSLSVGGLLVTGTLVSPDRWFSAVIDLVEQHAAPAGDGMPFAEVLSLIAGQRVPSDLENESDWAQSLEASAALKDRSYLHLLDARIALPDGSWSPAMPWRCLASHVHGWSLVQPVAP